MMRNLLNDDLGVIASAKGALCERPIVFRLA
jgi:hypothetical protein